ncbi:MAG TPA: ComEA family DNA-binding protein [Longimicrobium sp.]|nr:ComEA family DNA-binding protein [Longimicrobium sp.]
MMSTTPQERLALAIAALLLMAGVGARMLHGGPEPVEWNGSASADSAMAARLRTEVAGEVKRAERRNTPLAEGERIDPNTASADDLARLPKVGEGTAERIVAWRAARGPFRTLADLDSVPGIGPAALKEIAPHVTLAGAPAPSPSRSRPFDAREEGGRSDLRASSVSSASPAGGVVDLNSASAGELEALPGVGPALARRIVEWRAANGRFRAPEDLDRVPGIGPAMLARLRDRVRATP